RENGKPPLNYARAALLARERGIRRVLDFGCGIGSGALCLATVGCEVHAADIAKELLRFVQHRFSLRRRSVRLIDLNEERPSPGRYDMITGFDVLEHIPDQRGKLRELASYLCDGGYLLAN